MLILSANRFKDQPLPDPITAAFMQAAGIVGTGSKAQLKLPKFAKGLAADLLRIEYINDEYWATLLADVACTCANEPVPTAADDHSAFLLQNGDALALGPFLLDVQILPTPADPLADLIEAELQDAEATGDAIALAAKPSVEEALPPSADGLAATAFAPSAAPLLASAFTLKPAVAAVALPPMQLPSAPPADFFASPASVAIPAQTLPETLFATSAPSVPLVTGAVVIAASTPVVSQAAELHGVDLPLDLAASPQLIEPAKPAVFNGDDSQSINLDDLHASTADESLQALWDGLGLQRDAVAGAAVYPSDENMFRIGMLLRECVQGVAALMDSRKQSRQPLDLSRTQLIEINNNPFKHQSAGTPELLDDLLRLLITNKLAKSFMPPAEAVKRSFDEIGLHFYALLQAQKQLHTEQLQAVSPASLRAELEAEPKAKRVTPALLWEHYQKRYLEIDPVTHTEYAYRRQLTDAYEAALKSSPTP
jgi:type VI secretion system FHA domain protein